MNTRAKEFVAVIFMICALVIASCNKTPPLSALPIDEITVGYEVRPAHTLATGAEYPFPIKNVPEGGMLLTAVAAPEGASILRVTVSWKPRVGDAVKLREIEIVPAANSERLWEGIVIDLSAHAGKSGALVFAGRGDMGDGNYYLAKPVIADKPRLDRPNIILIVFDSLRRDHVGVYGYERNTTPTVDKLAREGSFFINAVAAASATKPAMASVFTSTNPEENLAIGSDLVLSRNLPSLVQTLEDAGYFTNAVQSNPHLDKKNGFTRGFLRYADLPPPRRGLSASAVAVAHHGLEYIKNSPRPYFLYMHFMDSHVPYASPPQFRNHFMEEPDEELLSRTALRWEYSVPVAVNNPTITKARPLVVAHYDGAILFIDQVLAAFLAEAGKLGMDNTMIIVMGDHGEEFLDHGGIIHGRTVYREVVDVPLVMHFPGRIKPGTVIKALVSMINLAPTILDLAGVPKANGMRGESCVRLFKGGELKNPVAFSQIRDNRHVKPNDFFGMRTGDLHYIYNRYTKSRELYDLVNDPEEKENIHGSDSQRDKLLKKRMSDYIHVNSARAVEVEHVDLDEQKKDQLRALGYLE